MSYLLARSLCLHYRCCPLSWYHFSMTVATGTLNGLIFYVNIVAVNRSILLPFEEQNFTTVFISWLNNLELGIDTCYFPGMDAYSKTWIQLSFVAAYCNLPYFRSQIFRVRIFRVTIFSFARHRAPYIAIQSFYSAKYSCS